MALDFENLTAEQIKEYMDTNASKEQKKEFIKEAFITRKKKKGVEVKDANGKAIMYQVTDENGNLKFKKNGQPMMRKKIEYVEQAEGEEITVFSLLKAKWWFAEKFPEAVENVPKRKENKEKVGDIFADWI